jgi:hypothetical protein
MRKHHARQLMPAPEVLGSVVAVVFVDKALKFVTGQQPQELCKHISSLWHGGDSGAVKRVRAFNDTGESPQADAVRGTEVAVTSKSLILLDLKIQSQKVIIPIFSIYSMSYGPI